jgi:hypothetical protein
MSFCLQEVLVWLTAIRKELKDLSDESIKTFIWNTLQGGQVSKLNIVQVLDFGNLLVASATVTENCRGIQGSHLPISFKSHWPIKVKCNGLFSDETFLPKSGIQVSPHKLPGFDAYDYYVSFTMFWRDVLCRMWIVRLWPEMPGNRVQVIPDGEQFSGEGDTSRAPPVVLAGRPRILIHVRYWPKLSISSLLIEEFFWVVFRCVAYRRCFSWFAWPKPSAFHSSN